MMSDQQEMRLIEILLKMSEIFEVPIPNYRIYSMKHPMAPKAVGFYNGRINLREDIFGTNCRKKYRSRWEYTVLHEFAHHVVSRKCICHKEKHTHQISHYAKAVYEKTNQIDAHGPVFTETLFRILGEHDKPLWDQFKTDYYGLMTPYTRKLMQSHRFKKFSKKRRNK